MLEAERETGLIGGLQVFPCPWRFRSHGTSPKGLPIPCNGVHGSLSQGRRAELNELSDPTVLCSRKRGSHAAILVTRGSFIFMHNLLLEH
jgi:hypothetical protein